MRPLTFLVGLALSSVLLAPMASSDNDALQKGIAFYQQGKYAEAETALKQASGPEASAYLAASLSKLKRYSDAEAPAKSAVGAQPTHAVGVAALGEALVGQKKYDEAVDRMSAALNAKSDLAYAHYWRGQAFQNKKLIARMVEDYQDFLKLAPNAPEAAAVKVLLASLR